MWNLDIHTSKLTWFQSCILCLTSDYSCPPRGRALNDEWEINSEFKVLTFKRADEMALLVIKYMKEWWWYSPGLFWREQYLFGLNALYTCVCDRVSNCTCMPVCWLLCMSMCVFCACVCTRSFRKVSCHWTLKSKQHDKKPCCSTFPVGMTSNWEVWVRCETTCRKTVSQLKP